MPRTVSIGCQDFEKLRVGNNFYVDKTAFIPASNEENSHACMGI